MANNDSALQKELHEIWHNAYIFSKLPREIFGITYPHLLFSAHLCRSMAIFIMQDYKDQINTNRVSIAIEYLLQHKFFTYPEYIEAEEYVQHLINCLEIINNNVSMISKIIGIVRAPTSVSHINMIATTLDPYCYQKNPIINKHTTMTAIIASWFFKLRQQVGSCFSTALSILIQSEQPFNFLNGLVTLINEQKLSRVVNGELFMVPLIPSYGVGSLHKTFLISFPQEFHKIMTSAFWSRLFPLDKIISTNQVNISMPTLPTLLSTQDLITLYYKTVYVSKQPSNILYQALNVFISLEDFALLRTWDYSLASFSETKGNLAQRMFYISLGWNSEQKHGMGAPMLENISTLFEDHKNKHKALKDSYSMVVSAQSAASARLLSTNNAESIQSSSRNLTTYSTYVTQLEIEMQASHQKLECLSDLFNLITDQLLSRIPEWFAEIYYVPTHRTLSKAIQEDSPARFQLANKAEVSKGEWKRISSKQDFISSISNFFSSIETEVVVYINKTHNTDVTQEIASCFQILLQTLHDNIFWQYTFKRIAQHNNISIPKEVTDPEMWLLNQSISPWLLPSGGSPDILLSVYYMSLEPPKTIISTLSSPLELVHMISQSISTETRTSSQNNTSTPIMENLPPYFDTHNTLIATSPSHVFRIYTQLMSINSCLQHTPKLPIDTAVKTQLDKIIDSMKLTIFRPEHGVLVLNRLTNQFLIHTTQDIIYTASSLFDLSIKLNNQLAQTYDKEYVTFAIESAILQCLPFTDISQLYDILPQLISTMCNKYTNIDYLTWLQDITLRLHQIQKEQTFIGAHDCLELFLQSQPIFSQPIDFKSDIIKIMRKLGLLVHSPIIIGDMNWANNIYIGIGVSPWSYQPELWVCLQDGFLPKSLKIWDKYFTHDINRKDLEWKIFFDKSQYNKHLFSKNVFQNRYNTKKIIE